MELKFIIPKVQETFGNLEFAGEGEVENGFVNGKRGIVSRTYNLFSDVQRADNIAVTIPAKAGEKKFGFEEKVKLVNPRLEVEGQKIDSKSAYSSYILYADDLEKA